MPSITKHAGQRVRQRGYRDADLDLILRHGTDISDGVILTRRDVDQRQRELKHEAAALERLAGSYTVLQGDTVITIYRPSKKVMRRLKG